MTALNVGDAGDHDVEGLFPGDRREDPVFAQKRQFGAPRGVENVVLGSPFEQSLPRLTG